MKLYLHIVHKFYCHTLLPTYIFIQHKLFSLYFYPGEKENSESFAAETMAQLINDIGTIRTHLNSTELQLYEANEKIAELIENVIFFLNFF